VITAVTTCMGRMCHLEVTLPHMLENFDRVIVVDWSCPDKSGEYAASLGASVVYQYGERYFSSSRAKNCGAKLVTSEYICFIDADSFCMPSLRKQLDSLLEPGIMVLSALNADGSDVNDTVGFLACQTEAFWNVGGFDESWIGWGNEDIHLRGKLFLDEGLKVSRLNGMALGALAHSNAMRSSNREEPIEKTAATNFYKLEAWFVSKGIEDFHTNPKVKAIAFQGHRAPKQSA
jgi:glycosyltransferase involved in cell wall biosynthesis